MSVRIAGLGVWLLGLSACGGDIAPAAPAPAPAPRGAAAPGGKLATPRPANAPARPPPPPKGCEPVPARVDVPANASTSPAADGGPSQRETLQWIVDNFPRGGASSFQNRSILNATETHKTLFSVDLVAVEACKLTFNVAYERHVSSVDSAGIPSGKPIESRYCHTTTIDLQYNDPTSYRVEQDVDWLNGGFGDNPRQFTAHVYAVSYQMRVGDQGGARITGESSGLIADDREHAQRLARALSAASLHCGAKAPAF